MTAPLIVRTLRNEATERTPVWFMRQAGRHLPEYRALRADHGFLELCRLEHRAAKERCTQAFKSAITAARKNTNLCFVLCDELAHKVLAQKASSAGDEVSLAHDCRCLRTQRCVGRSSGELDRWF